MDRTAQTAVITRRVLVAGFALLALTAGCASRQMETQKSRPTLQKAVRKSGPPLLLATAGGSLRGDARNTGRSLGVVRPNMRRVWTFKTDCWINPQPVSGPDGTIYFSGNDPNLDVEDGRYPPGRVFAVDHRTGRKRWETVTDWPMGPPVVAADGTVFVEKGARPEGFFDFFGGGGAVLALDGKTGKEKWTYTNRTSFMVGPVLTPKGLLILRDARGMVHAIEAASGWLRWKRGVGHVLDLDIPSCGHDGTVFIVGAGGLYALDGETRRVRWKRTLRETPWPTSISWQSAVGEDGTVFFGEGHDGFVAVDPTTGREKWRLRFASKTWSAPAIGRDGTVYVGAADISSWDKPARFFALDARTGKIRWERLLSRGQPRDPTVARDGTLIMNAPTSGKILALDRNGESRHILPFQGGDPVLGKDGTLYLVSGTGTAGKEVGIVTAYR